MNIALDYDETFTRDPLMWFEVAKLFHANGHTVYGVTYRFPHNTDDMSPLYFGACDGGVFFTSHTSKNEYMSKQGILIHVWIDDLAVL